MKSRFLYLLLPLILILNSGSLFGQIIDFAKDSTYRRVFVDTDNFGESYLEVLENAYPLVINDTLRYSILNDLAYYWHTRNLIKSLEFTKEGLALTREKNNSLWEGRFQITQGAVLLRMEKLDSARIVLESSLGKIKKTDLPKAYTQLGYVYEREGRLSKAAAIAMETLQLANELNDHRAMAVALSDLSNLFWKEKRYEEALEYGLESISLFEERGLHDLDYDFTLYVVGNSYLALNNYEEALKYYEHSISIGKRYGFYNNLCDVYISIVYLESFLNNFDKAEKAGENAIKYAVLLDNNFMLMRSWVAIGKSQNLQGKYISAIKSIENSIEIATTDFSDNFFLSEAYEALGKAYAGNHNYQEAYQAYAKYDNLQKALFTTESNHHVSQLLTEYEVAQKESTIMVQEDQIKKEKSIQRLLGLIAGLLSLLLLLLCNTIQTNKKKNKLLKKQNNEKEFLLKEIHHRVKNNLEIVSSLLALQAEQLEDESVSEAMEKSQHRVHSMSMIHQKLYQGKSLASIEMKAYFINLVDYLSDIYDTKKQIVIHCDMNSLELDIDSAIPIGLIVNELVTNALKYAFPEDRKGEILIKLCYSANCLHLEVSDNGIGKNTRDKIEGTGFGTQLIELLTRQLEGKMTLNIKKGTAVSFEFQQHKAA
ncbi:histidine kinase dimerization/phosphoacceptor domain -containing protein [Eudoraea sp.]|uniref:histidine kinase dimerization/phosphoacceptor domain -containing protein n=1 Tax=Eudoraea sp. TaxID=1979955 RepID=UPI003C713C8E